MIEVLKQALDALETEVSIDWTNNDEFNASAEKMHDAITSLQQAIAELESQEPMAHMYPDDLEKFQTDETFAYAYSVEMGSPTKGETVPLYTHPPQRTWQGLTDEEIKTICVENGWDSSWQSMRFAHAIEAKLKERNI